MPVWVVATTVLVGNLPFGYWRANVRKFSVQWALAIHVPVLLAIGLRLLAGIPLDPLTFAIMATSFFLGQSAGQRSRTFLAALLPVPLSSCLPYDLIRALLA